LTFCTVLSLGKWTAIGVVCPYRRGV